MKKEYSKYIKSKLKEIIPTKFPCFVFWDQKTEYGLDYNFVCEDNNSLKTISIQNSHDENAFMVELFWSDDGTKFQNDLTHFLFEDDEDVLKKICNETKGSLRIRLSVFYAHDFDSWWAIDPTGKIVKSIKENGFITSDAYFQFYSEDSFLSDEKKLSKEQFQHYIDPLVYNVIELLNKYAITLFECLDNK
jgi:hypothetical protein